MDISHKKPDIPFLFEITEAHLTRIPFENISKLYYLQTEGFAGLPDLERYLSGIEQNRFGGTCYANNYYLHLLLNHLGFGVKLCGADMSQPDVHLVNIVQVAGREFLVDVGYAAPFIRPFPLFEGRDINLDWGRDGYILKRPDNRGYIALEMYHEGVLKHGYQVNPRPRRIEEFRQVISDSFGSAATFMNSLLLVRCAENWSLRIHNQSVIETKGNQTEIRKINSRAELPSAIQKWFGIPSEITVEAISNLGELGDPWT